MENGWVASVAGAALAVAVALGVARRFRARAVKRWLTAWDAYAEREIAQQRRARMRAAEALFFGRLRVPTGRS